MIANAKEIICAVNDKYDMWKCNYDKMKCMMFTSAKSNAGCRVENIEANCKQNKVLFNDFCEFDSLFASNCIQTN